MRRLCQFTAVLLLLISAGAAAAQEATPSATPLPCPPLPAGVEQEFSYYIGQAESLFATSSYNAAALAYTCALGLNPEYVPALAQRGYIYTQQGDSTRAFADYERALALDETYIPAYVNRGALYTRLGNFGLAINDLTLAISLDPNNAAALNNRAVVHAIEANYELALADLNAAIVLAPEYARAYASRAAVYSALAARDYQQFVIVAETNRLPAGTPSEVLITVDDSIRTGDFSVWLSLLTANE